VALRFCLGKDVTFHVAARRVRSFMTDYRIFDGARGGLSFDFIPCHYAYSGESVYDRSGPDVFNIREEVFVFIENAVAEHFPDWEHAYRHWGITWIPRDTWLEILESLLPLKSDLKTGMHTDIIVRKHVLYPGFLETKRNGLIYSKRFSPGYVLKRNALVSFLENFDERVRRVLETYPYLLIYGI
jgi:hypothetical protein